MQAGEGGRNNQSRGRGAGWVCVWGGVGGGSTNLQELLSLLPGVPVEVLLAARGEPHGDNSICNVRQVQVEAIANVPALLQRDGRPARAEHCVRVISRSDPYSNTTTGGVVVESLSLCPRPGARQDGGLGPRSSPSPGPAQAKLGLQRNAFPPWRGELESLG